MFGNTELAAGMLRIWETCFAGGGPSVLVQEWLSVFGAVLVRLDFLRSVNALSLSVLPGPWMSLLKFDTGLAAPAASSTLEI